MEELCGMHLWTWIQQPFKGNGLALPIDKLLYIYLYYGHCTLNTNKKSVPI
jgi:hypothetical protein